MTLLTFNRFTATLILREIKCFANSNGPKMLILTNSEVLNFDFSKFEPLSIPKFTKNSNFRVFKIAKYDLFGLFEFPKNWFHVKSEWRYNYQFQQSPALTSHFKSFCGQSINCGRKIQMCVGKIWLKKFYFYRGVDQVKCRKFKST